MHDVFDHFSPSPPLVCKKHTSPSSIRHQRVKTALQKASALLQRHNIAPETEYGSIKQYTIIGQSESTKTGEVEKADFKIEKKPEINLQQIIKGTASENERQLLTLVKKDAQAPLFNTDTIVLRIGV